MTPAIPWLQPALNFFLNRILIHEYCSHISAKSHPFKGTIIKFILWLRPAFWSGDTPMHLVLSAFTSKIWRGISSSNRTLRQSLFWRRVHTHQCCQQEHNDKKLSWTSYNALVTIYTARSKSYWSIIYHFVLDIPYFSPHKRQFFKDQKLPCALKH